MNSVVSTCIYCANACKLEYMVENGLIKAAMPCKKDSVSFGKPCIKGLTIAEVAYKGRIVKPMIRKGKKLKEVSWELALAEMYRKLRKYDPSEIFVGASGKVTNEDNWVIQKFTRLVFGTNNIDSTARLCHAPTVIGFKDTIGIAASPGYLDDIPKLDCLLVIGSNPASNHPITFQRILEMKKKGGRMITVSPILSVTAQQSDKHVYIQPGTEVAFINSIINYLIENKLYYKKAERYPGFSKLKEITSTYTFDYVSKITGVPISELKDVSEMIASCEKFGIMHGMGLTQHLNGVQNVHSLVNLALLKNGKIVTGRGEVNVQGAGDLLCVPDVLTESKVDLARLQKEWGKIPMGIGMNLIEAIGFGEAKAILISSINPAHSMPDLNRVHKNLKKMFVVQFDSYFNLTSNFADIILPTPLLIEREGTITSGERRIRHVRKVTEPFGDSIPEWKIFSRLAKIFDVKGFDYLNEKEITKEFVRLVKDYQKINVEKIYRDEDQFASKEIKFKKFAPEKFKGVESIKTKKYPFILFTFRSRYHFLSDEATSKSKTLNKMPVGPYLYINPGDAKELKIKDLDEVRVTSKVSSIKGYAKITKIVPRGYIGAHFHFENLLVNKLIPLEFDKESYTPNFKSVAVKIAKI